MKFHNKYTTKENMAAKAFYGFVMKRITGEAFSFGEALQGKVVLMTNVASR